MSEIFNRRIVKGTSPYEDKILAIFEVQKNRTKICYGDLPTKIFLANEEKLKQIRKMPQSAKYILIKYDKRKYETLQAQLNATIKEADFLKDLTQGKINLYRTGSVAKTALQLFYDLCPVKEETSQPDPIEFKEMNILLKAKLGAMIWAKPYKGKAYKADVVSEYPSVMVGHAQIPFGGVTYKKITNEELKNMDYFKVGFYHAIVENPNLCVFKTNSENWYTHSDLNYAMKELKYKITMIEDVEENALIYTRLKNIKDIFKPFIDYLFQFKKNGIKQIKKYLNALWGALSQKNTFTTAFEDMRITDVPFMSMPKFSIDELHLADDPSNYSFVVYKEDQLYKLPYARIGHFILSLGRIKIGRILMENIDDVVFVHTDGIISKKEIKSTKTKIGEELGELKMEGFANCEILNACQYIFDGTLHGKKEKDLDDICLFKF